MSGASKTDSPLVLYAEGVDPEADLVLVCGGRKFYVRRAVCDAFKVVAASPDKSNGAEFDVLGHDANTLEKLLLLVDPDAAIALTPKLITQVLPLAHFLGADALIQSFYLFLEANFELKSNVASAAFALDKLLAEEPKWSDRTLNAMVRTIIPCHPISEGYAKREMRQWEERQREKLVKERTPLLKGLHASTTMALFQRVAIMACERSTKRINKTIHDIGPGK
jgi:hypothetical protein